MKSGTCLERAGQIFIRIVWIENRLVDFIIFKKHPRVKAFYIKNKRTSPKFVLLRKQYWKQDFPKIKDEFFAIFPNIKNEYKSLLEDLNRKRDAIGHCFISKHLDFIFYQPNSKITSARVQSLRRAVVGPKTKGNLYKISFDDTNFQKMLTAIGNIDEKLFPEICKELSIDYDRLVQ